jgi:hypothetical protein
MRKSATTAAALALSAIAFTAAAQQPPAGKPAEPQQETRDPRACANARAEVDRKGDVEVRDPKDRSLSEQLAKSDGVICPPGAVDPDIKKPTPDTGSNTPVIPPPGSNDPTLRPK